MTHKTVNQIDAIILSSETIGRQYFAQIVNSIFPNYQDMRFSEGKYSKWDVAVMAEDGQKYLVEIKVRGNSSTKYTTSMAEMSKISALTATTEYKAIYVNFFDDNTAFVWDMDDKSLYYEEDKYANRITANPAAGKVVKKCAMFYNYLATSFKYSKK